MLDHFINQYGFPTAVLIALAFFMWRVWVWYTSVRWPAEQVNRSREIDSDSKASEAIAGIKIILADIAATTNKTYDLLAIHHTSTLPAVTQIAAISASVELLKTDTVRAITQSVIESVKENGKRGNPSGG